MVELRWWILLTAVLLGTATWWRLSRCAHVRRGLRGPYGMREDS